MPGEVNMGGGFGTAFRSQMSDSLQRRLAVDDAREQQSAALEEHRRTAEREEWRERAFQAAAQEAVKNGASVLDAAAGRGLGNTVGEFIAKVNAQQDFEDAMAAANQHREFRRWQLAQTAATSADTSDYELEAATRAQYVEEHRPQVLARRQRRDEARAIARDEARDAVRVDRRLRREGFGGV